MYGVLHEQPNVPLLEAGFYRPGLLDRFGKAGSVSSKKNSAALSGWDADQARRGTVLQMQKRMRGVFKIGRS
jgi:hypothetical protein